MGCEGVWGRRGLVMLVRVVQNLCGGGVCVDHSVGEVRYRRFGEGLQQPQQLQGNTTRYGK